MGSLLPTSQSYCKDQMEITEYSAGTCQLITIIIIISPLSPPGGGQLNWQKPAVFLLRNQRTQSGSATATAKWGRKSQKGEYQRRKALHFMYRLCPSLWMIADHTHRGQTQRRLKLRLKELSWGPAHHRWDRVCSLTLIKWIVKTKTSTLFHKHHRNQAKCSWHPGYILKLIDIPITRKRKRE